MLLLLLPLLCLLLRCTAVIDGSGDAESFVDNCQTGIEAEDWDADEFIGYSEDELVSLLHIVERFARGDYHPRVALH